MADKYWWEKDGQSAKDGVSNQSEQRYWWNDGSVEKAIGNDAANRVNTWMERNNSYLSDSNKRYESRKFNYEDAYVADSASWLETTTKRADELEAERQEVLSYIRQNKKYLNPEWVKSVEEALVGESNKHKSIIENATMDNDYWLKFTPNKEQTAAGYTAEKLYSEWQKSEQQRTEDMAYDVKAGEQELALLKVGRDSYIAQQEAKRQEKLENETFWDKIGRWSSNNPDTSIPLAGASQYVGADGYTNPYDERIAELEARIQRAKDVQQYENQYAFFKSYTEMPDFDAGSAYNTTYRGGEKFNAWSGMYTDTGYDDILYDYINKNEHAIKRMGIQQKNQYFYGLDTSYLQEMTEDEIKLYNYLYEPGHPEAANQYLAFLLSDLTYRHRQREQAFWAAYAKEHPFVASGSSIVTSPLKGLSALGQIADYAADGTIDQNAGYNKFSYTSSAIRDQVSAEIAKSGKWGGVGSWTYQLGMSMGDFLMTTAVSGGNSTISLALMGSGAMADTVISAKDRGLSDDQAMILGVVAGGAEIITEKFSLDALFKGGLEKGAVKYILTNAFTEGAEEVSSSLINLFADVIVSKDKSEWQMQINDYLAKNPKATESEAFQKVLGDTALSLGLDFLGGSLMGGAMGSGGAAINSTANYVSEARTGRTIMGSETGVPALLDLASEMSGASAEDIQKSLTKQANKVSERMDAGNKSNNTARKVAKLYDTVQTAKTSQNQADIVKSLTRERNGFSEKSATAIAEAMVARANGQELSLKQERLLNAYKDDVRVQNAEKTIIKNDKSTMGQRNQKVAQLGQNIAFEAAVKEFTKQQYTEKEFTPEGKFEVTTDGKAIDKDGNLIDIKGVASISSEGMLLDLGDGKTINAKDVSYADKNAALIYEAVAKLGDKINAETANKLIKQYDGKNAQVFSRGIAQAYTYGFHGISKSELNGKLASDLSSAQINAAYELGKQYRPVKDMADKANAKVKKAPGEKGVYYRDKDGNAVDIRTYLRDSNTALKDVQSTAIEVMEKMSKIMGVRFNVFESWVENGKRYHLNEDGVKTEGNPNGFYDQRTGEIYIDLNAGNGYEGVMLFTVAHELTHFMRQWSPAQFTKIAKIIFQHGEMKGSVTELVALKQANAKTKGKYLSYDAALEEVVADGMETILKDGNVVEFMADVKKQDQRLWAKLKEWFQNLAEFLKEMVTAYSSYSAQSTEGARVAEFSQKLLNQIEQIWAKGALDAGENYRKAQDAIDEKSGDQSTKFSNRQSEKNSLATEETVKYSNRKNFFPGNVFPSGKTHTDAFEWAHRKEVKTGDKRLMLYRGTYYRVEKFDDVDFGYLITKKYDAQDYNEELKEYGEIDSEESIQERVDRIDALYRGPDGHGQGRYYADSSGAEHRGENLSLFSVDQDTAEGREDYSRTERDRQGGLRDQRHAGRESLEWTPQELYDKMEELDRKLVYATGRYATMLKNKREHYASMLDEMKGWDQVRFSDRDSDGNQLSLEQQKFFKDSQVRDKKGNLLVVYHGTAANFNIFKKGDVGFHFGTKGAARGRAGYGKNVNIKAVYLNITNPIVFDEDLGSWDADYRLTKELYDRGILTKEEALFVLRTDDGKYKRATESANKKLTAVLMDKGYDGIAYQNTFETKKATTSYIAFSSNQAKETTNLSPTSNPDIRYSDRCYSYEALISKPDMRVTEVGGNVPKNRADVIIQAKKNAAKLGKFNPKTGSVSVHVDDIDTDITLGTKGLEHGLRRISTSQTDPTWLITIKAGEIIKNAIRINEITPSKKEASGAYVLMGMAQNKTGDLYAVRFVVNQYSHELTSLDVLYAINAKKEDRLRSMRPGFQGPVTDPKISIADLLDLVNKYFPDVLPEDVLKHYGYTSRPEGDLGEDALYQDRADDSVSNRSLLANAFEGIITNPIEKKKLQEYKEQVALLDEQEQKLRELNAQIKDLSFGKGPRDKTKIAALRDEAVKTANRIAIYDKRIFGLEAATPLQNILKREREIVRKRERQKGKEALAEQKAEFDAKQQETIDKWRENRKTAVAKARETAEKRDARAKLQKLVLDTAKWISYPAKTDVKCPDILKKPYADFLNGIDLSSKRLADGGDATKNDLRLANAMDSLATALDKIMLSQDPSQDVDNVLDTGYLDLPADFVQKLRDMTEGIKAMMVEGEYVVNTMTAAEVRKLSQMIRTLNHAIKTMSKLYANLRFANIEALGLDTMEFIDALGEIEKTGGIKDFVQWDNALPYYAFKRFGKGGESVFEGLMDAQDKLAFLAQEIFNFRDKAWTDKEAKAWSEDTHTIKLPNGTELTLTTADAMSIYCLSRREQGLQHLLGGGTRIMGIQKGSQKAKDSRSLLTIKDIDEIISSLTDRKKKVAEDIQEFMSTVCSDWGNEVSMKRFLTKEFNEKFYFPIESNDENLPTKDPAAQQSDLFRLLNISATKPITPGANNEVIIRNIFDVFTGHASDMARLNAYGMPLLDYMKWLNYREKTANEEGQITVRGVRKSMEKAFGNAANSYVLNLVKDVNGRPSDGGDPTILMKWMRNAKTASVGSSLRVATLQITSYPRAALVLSPKSLALGLTKIPNIKRAKKYCGIALWKSFGFYDTNISRSIEDQMRGVKDVKQKLIELSLKGAEWGDAITWGALWNACEYEVAKTTKNKVGSEEFYQEVGKKLREVVYRTQVVDSTLTRSQLMRSKRGMAQEAAAFMSEPTLSANILMDAGLQFSMEKRRTGSAKIAWKNTGKYIGRAVAVYAIGQLAAALLEGLWDAWRDDEDEEFKKKYLDAFIENLALDLVPFNKIPIVSDVFEAALTMFDVGFYSSDKMSTTWLTQAVSAVDAWKSALSGESSTTVYNALYKTTRAISSFYGVSFSGVMREGVALWNNTAGSYDSTLKIRQYELSKGDLGNELYEAIVSGNTRQADSLKAQFEDQDSMHSAVRKALRENDPRIKAAAQAQLNGDPSERVRIAREIIADGFVQDDVVAAINAEINAMTPDAGGSDPKKKGFYTAEDFAKEIANRDQAAAYAAKADVIETAQKNGKSAEDAEKSFNSSAKSALKEQFLVGNLSEQETINALTTFCGFNEQDALSDVQYWAFKKEYPEVFADDQWFDTYYDKIADSGISIDVYMGYRETVSTITGDGKKERRMAVINSLPITRAQKDALYFAEGWAESKLYEAPWH